MSKKFPIILYHNCVSPPSRMALMAVRNMGLEIEVKILDIYKGEQNTHDFLKINPLHQVRRIPQCSPSKQKYYFKGANSRA